MKAKKKKRAKPKAKKTTARKAKPSKKVEAAKPKKAKRKRSKKTGRKAGRQPLAIGQKTEKFTLRIPESESPDLIKRADDLLGAISGKAPGRNVSGYLRELVRRDLAGLKAS